MKAQLPSIGSYGEYSSSNYGAHTLKVSMQLPDGSILTVWFSYETPIAFYSHATGKVVRENSWGPTTGKHLNWVDGGNKKARVSSDKFEELWQQVQGSSALQEV